MEQRIAFIASLGHSGSTLLDLVLGRHSRLIGLGEIARVIAPGASGLDKTAQSICSCGHTLRDCTFWSRVTAEIESRGETTLSRRYATVFEVFDSVFGPEFVPVDSSKYLAPLTVLHRDLRLAPRVLFLLKDVRSFTVSEIDNARRKQSGSPRHQRVRAWSAFRRWYAENRKMQGFLQRAGLRTCQLGYEELCLHPEPILHKVCNFLGEAFEPEMLAATPSRSHVIRGNRMRNQPDKQAVGYDDRWFSRREWLLPALLCRRIMQYNTREVYANRLADRWGK